MRTTITIEDQVFLEAKQLAAESHKTLGNIVEDALRSKFADPTCAIAREGG